MLWLYRFASIMMNHEYLKNADTRQYAKAVGASPIVAVAGKKNEDLVKSLGATYFVDYVSGNNIY